MEKKILKRQVQKNMSEERLFSGRRFEEKVVITVVGLTL